MITPEQRAEALFNTRKRLTYLLEDIHLKDVVTKHSHLPKAIYGPLQKQLTKVNAEIAEFFNED